MRSINTIAVKLSINPIGDGNARAGRNKIVALAKQMGLRTPLPDTPSLPIGADRKSPCSITPAPSRSFPNGGMAVTPHAALEVRSATGELIWRADRDLPKPRRVMPAQVAADINMMLNKAVEEGTGRRTILPGVKTSGKTGTTNAYRDAWFDGYSGNMTAAIWVGNDDYAPTNRMTGGSLPGMIWQQIMAYAHQGIEIKPYPGVAPSPAPRSTAAAPQTETTKAADYVPPPNLLTRKGADILVRVEKMMEDATKALGAPTAPSACARARSQRRAPARRPRVASAGASVASASRAESDKPARRASIARIIQHMSRDRSCVSSSAFCFRSLSPLSSASARPCSRCTRGTAFGAFTIGAWTSFPRNGTARDRSLCARAMWRAAAHCRSAPATASRFSPAPMTPAKRSTAAATSS